MPSAGDNVLARWRESYGWWNDEPAKECIRVLDAKGRWKQHERFFTYASLNDSAPQVSMPTGEDLLVRAPRKLRDEKVAAACGKLPPASYANHIHSLSFQPQRQVTGIAYAPLHALSGYSFGRSILLPPELAAIAAKFQYPAIALVDRHSLSGAVEFVRACQGQGIKPLLGASVEVPEGGELVLIARNQEGYRNLSRLLSDCHLEEPRQFPLARWERLARHSEGLLCLTGGDTGPLDRLLLKDSTAEAFALAQKLIEIYGQNHLFIEIERSFLPWTVQVTHRLLQLAETLNVLPVAGGVITHQYPTDFPAQDVALCANLLALVEEPYGRKPLRHPDQPNPVSPPLRSMNAERYFLDPSEVLKRYQFSPELVSNTMRVTDLCDDKVLPVRPPLPPLLGNDDHALREIVEANARVVYPNITAKHRRRLKFEVDRITRLGFSTHFLIASEMCRWAKEHDIHLSGRGSAVDSAVAYVLGFSRIDAIRHNLHFDRFLPADGSKRPDIDIDFEARRRDDVRGYLIRRFGIERTANVAAFGSYRTRGIIRQVGKAMGLNQETLSFLAKRVHGGVPAHQLALALEKRPELKESAIPKAKLRWILEFAERLMDVPFDIGCHSSGLVISAVPIRDIVPVVPSASFNSTESESEEQFLRVMQWDKRSAKHYFDKFDILCLRGQDVLSGTERRIRSSEPEFDAQRIDIHNSEVFRAMKSGELIGIPQSASPAMRQAHIRMRTDNLHDASLVQAGIRPGVGGAVKINELIARRRGLPYSFEHPDFEPILGITYGIIVFQEQVDQLLQTFCHYTSGEAEDIRDLIHKRRRETAGAVSKDVVVARVLQNGYSLTVAEKVYDLVAGFKGYGFAQGHALAFAEISLRCVHLMQNEPAAYFAALLSSQPAGYYGPCTIVNEARTRGVAILRPDVNVSEDAFEVETLTLENPPLQVPQGAIRVGLAQVSGLSQKTRERILSWPRKSVQMQEQKNRLNLPTQAPIAAPVALMESQPSPLAMQPFLSFFDFVRKVMPQRDELEALILCGAFDSLHPNRRALLWVTPLILQSIRSLTPQGKNPCLPLEPQEVPLDDRVEDFSNEEKAVLERQILGLDIDQHLMAYERAVTQGKALTTLEVKSLEPGMRAVVVGNPIRLRFPPTPSGKRVVFFDLEDETGLLNVTAFDAVYQRDGKAIVTGAYVTVIGQVQDRDGHKAFLASRVFEYRPHLLRGKEIALPVHGADFLVG